MFNKAFSDYCLCTLIAFFYFSVSTGHCKSHSKSLAQDKISKDFNKDNDETNFSSQLFRNNSNTTAETNILFWAKLHENSTSKTLKETETAEKSKNKTETSHDGTNDKISVDLKQRKSAKINQINEETKIQKALFNASNRFDSTIDKKILLHRNNCNLNISVQKTQNLKIDIEFQKLKNNTFGKCCIALNGQKNYVLGVVISNIHLYQNATEGEVIKIITVDYGYDFILKEYYLWSKYQPLLLTETHKVYVVLYYDVSSVPLKEKNSHFNLEIFNYLKYENTNNNESSYSSSFFKK